MESLAKARIGRETRFSDWFCPLFQKIDEPNRVLEHDGTMLLAVRPTGTLLGRTFFRNSGQNQSLKRVSRATRDFARDDPWRLCSQKGVTSDGEESFPIRPVFPQAFRCGFRVWDDCVAPRGNPSGFIHCRPNWSSERRLEVKPAASRFHHIPQWAYLDKDGET